MLKLVLVLVDAVWIGVLWKLNSLKLQWFPFYRTEIMILSWLDRSTSGWSVSRSEAPFPSRSVQRAWPQMCVTHSKHLADRHTANGDSLTAGRTHQSPPPPLFKLFPLLYSWLSCRTQEWEECVFPLVCSELRNVILKVCLIGYGHSNGCFKDKDIALHPCARSRVTEDSAEQWAVKIILCAVLWLKFLGIQLNSDSKLNDSAVPVWIQTKIK